MTSHQSEKPLYHCPECGQEKRRDYCRKCGTFDNTATNEIVESEKPPSCNVCRTKDAGMPVPGYIHDPGCKREKPPSGVEVLQQWKAEHVKEVHICGRWCKAMCEHLYRCQECDDRWPCPMFRLVEQIEEDRAALISLRQELWAFRAYYIGDHRLGLDPEANQEVARATKACAAADEALTLSKLEAR